MALFLLLAGTRAHTFGDHTHAVHTGTLAISMTSTTRPYASAPSADMKNVLSRRSRKVSASIDCSERDGHGLLGIVRPRNKQKGRTLRFALFGVSFRLPPSRAALRRTRRSFSVGG